MRRVALVCGAIGACGVLGGCTGTDVFLDHSFTAFGNNPNAPAGESEMLQRLRGEPSTMEPLLPEAGNVWPGPQAPDLTMQEIARQQSNGVPSVGGGTSHAQPRPGYAPQGPAPAVVQPGATPDLVAPPARSSGGSAVDVTGGRALPSYRHLQPTPGASGHGILVPNGNGTSTLIGPDGSISTVPTKP